MQGILIPSAHSSQHNHCRALTAHSTTTTERSQLTVQPLLIFNPYFKTFFWKATTSKWRSNTWIKILLIFFKKGASSLCFEDKRRCYPSPCCQAQHKAENRGISAQVCLCISRRFKQRLTSCWTLCRLAHVPACFAFHMHALYDCHFVVADWLYESPKYKDRLYTNI